MVVGDRCVAFVMPNSRFEVKSDNESDRRADVERAEVLEMTLFVIGR
ncbi:hypothetical protein T4B_14802 [Trichinella pseudospiralis]|uniref:Uncharacterized protein n=1 Tax=Trichinella pseudospiralis TaxID=6337 RepID=A0A0V1E4S4_TRIPS|nr:hypothetical protein T4A_550 [Trichinella pseudospiralis]KRZ27292.1 hypothetical protein T4B_14802 [Trichinella pseudospiralis]KRZ39876.1 hypothetical protein T4C_5687 [Trichinella pseudospiralis]